MIKRATDIGNEFDRYRTLNTKMTILFLIGLGNIALYTVISYKYPSILFDESLITFKTFIDIAIYFVVFITGLSILGRIYYQHKIKYNTSLHQCSTERSLDDNTARTKFIFENGVQIKKIKKTVIVLIVMLVIESMLYFGFEYFSFMYLSWFFLGLAMLTSALILVLLINMLLWKIQLNNIIKNPVK